MEKKSKNLSALLVAGAFVLVIVPAPMSAAETSAILAEFSPGDEPRWTMLKMNAAEPDGKLFLALTFTELRCPFTWGFLVFQGAPDNASLIRGWTLDFGTGRSGVEAQTGGANGAAVSAMQYEGTERCPSGEGLGLPIGGLPAGPLYFLEFTAGTPFRSHAALSSSQGGITLTGERSFGERTFYFNTSGLNDEGSTHAAVHSPPVCASPDLAEEDLCNPCCHWVGDTLFGADIGMNRRAEISFEHHPYFTMRVPSKVQVVNVSVTKPDGNIIVPGIGTGATVAGMNAGIGTSTIQSIGAGDAWPEGTYRFNLDLHANAHPETGSAWRIHAVDFQFPEEQAAP